MELNQNCKVKNVINAVLTKRISDIERYVLTIKQLHKINIAFDRLYQKNYNGFYRVRRGVEWQKIYYEIFERAKIEPISFEQVITELYKKTGNIEASFASKMVATLNPNMPIWDKYVLNNLNLKLEGKSKEERLKNAINLYGAIVEWYKKFLKSNEAQLWILEFDSALSKYAWFTPTKKVDLILWSMRGSEKKL